MAVRGRRVCEDGLLPLALLILGGPDKCKQFQIKRRSLLYNLRGISPLASQVRRRDPRDQTSSQC